MNEATSPPGRVKLETALNDMQKYNGAYGVWRARAALALAVLDGVSPSDPLKASTVIAIRQILNSDEIDIN